MSSLLHVTLIATNLIVIIVGATTTITSINAFVCSSKCCRYDVSRIRTSKLMFAKQQDKQDSPDDDEIGSYYYIQFSHAYSNVTLSTFPPPYINKPV
jgi:hypothetical protein